MTEQETRSRLDAAQGLEPESDAWTFWSNYIFSHLLRVVWSKSNICTLINSEGYSSNLRILVKFYCAKLSVPTVSQLYTEVVHLWDITSDDFMLWGHREFPWERTQSCLTCRTWSSDSTYRSWDSYTRNQVFSRDVMVKHDSETVNLSVFGYQHELMLLTGLRVTQEEWRILSVCPRSEQMESSNIRGDFELAPM